MSQPQDAHPPLPLDTDQHDPARWLPRLLRLVDEQTDLAMSLDSLSQQQSCAVAAGDAQTALEVLAQREPIVAAMTATARELEPFTDPRAGRVGALPAEERAAIRKRVNRYQDVLARVQQRDVDDRAALESLRAAVSEELATMAVGRTVVGAYGGGHSTRAAGPAGPSFQDRRA